MPTIALRSLAGGEIAPAFYARTDIAKYQSSLRTCRNFIVQKTGGIANRPGFQYICEVKTSADTTKLLPFIFNAEQTYCLEMGDKYMRVIQNGVRLTLSGAAWNSGANYVKGDVVSKSFINYYAIQSSTNKDPATETSYWHPMTGDIYEMPTAYDKTDLFELKHIQSADVISIVHNDYAPAELTRTGHTSWTMTDYLFAPTVQLPTGVSVSGSSGSNTYEYHVTSIDPETMEESIAGVGSGSSLAAASSSDPHTVTWTAVSGILQYNVYLVKDGQPSYVGIAGTNSFVNNGITPDFLEGPPTARNPFSGTGNYPAVVAYVQQRMTLANTLNNTEKVWMSKSANFKNFTTSFPIADDDAVTFNLAGSQVNAVRNIVNVGKMIVLTSSGEWEIAGDDTGIIVPGGVNPKQISYYGSSEIPPIIIGNSVLFVQARNSVIRDLYEDIVEGVGGSDLTIFAAHLFEGKQIVSWCYQQIPNSVVWVVLDDGSLLGFTYLRDHKVWAWHRHDTDGDFKDIICIPEGAEDVLYAIVERTINGVAKKYIERSYSRYLLDSIDSVFLDSALTYDGRHTGSTTMTLSGSGWTSFDSLTLTASAGFFVSGDVGNEIHLTGSDETLIRCRIISYTSSTVVTVNPNKDVPVSMQAVAVTTWGKAVDELSGLEHLEGKTVGVYADGFVVASPNNDSYTEVTVASGVVTLDRPYVVIHVGLPYISDAETLDIDNFGGTSLANFQKLVTTIGLFVQDTRGLFAGGKAPEDDDTDPLQGLYEMKARNLEGYDRPNDEITDYREISINNTWNSNGRVFIRQVDPVGCKILAAFPSGLVSGLR